MRETEFGRTSRVWGVACAIFATTALLLSSCSAGVSTDPSGASSTDAGALVSPSPDETAASDGSISLGNIYYVTSMEVFQGGISVPLEQDGSGLWNVAELLSDDTIPTQFVDSLSRISGMEEELPDDADELFTVVADGITLVFYANAEQTFVEHDATHYLLSRVSPFISRFNIDVLVTPLRLEVGGADITSILVSQDGTTTLDISPESSLSAAERYPLISGQFLRNHFHREYSVRSGNAKELAANSAGLKFLSEASDVPPEGGLYLRTVEVATPTKATEFELWQAGEDYYLRTVAGNFFLLAANQAELYLQEPFAIIDRFVALIPVNSMESFTLSTSDTSFSGTVIDPAAERPEFKLNDREVDQTALRKAMQYVGNIHGVREYKDEAVSASPWASLEYVFDSDGAPATRSIEFFELDSDDGELAAFEDGKADFVVTKTMIDDALVQLDAL